MEDQVIASSDEQSEINFFRMLSAVGSVDITLRILQSGNTFTLDVNPGSTSSKQKSFIVSGTPEDLDKEFLKKVLGGASEIAAFRSNLEDVKASIKDSPADNKTLKRQTNAYTKKAAPKKAAKPAKKTASKSSKAAPAAAKVEEPSMFPDA